MDGRQTGVGEKRVARSLVKARENGLIGGHGLFHAIQSQLLKVHSLRLLALTAFVAGSPRPSALQLPI
jgi:hypothetical protein